MNTTEVRFVRLNTNWVFILVVTAILLVAAWQIRAILMLIFAAIMLVIFFTIPIRWLTSRRLPIGSGVRIGRGLAIVLTLVGFVVLLVTSTLMVLPTLVPQFVSIGTDVLPAGVDRAVDWWESGEAFQEFPWLQSMFQDVTFNERVINQAVGQISGALGELGGSVLPFVGGVANALLSFLIILFLSVYFLAEPQVYINRIIRVTPLSYRERMNEILIKMDAAVRSWVEITVVSMLVAGVGTALGLSLLGVDEAIALGVLAGFASFIPNFGTLAALIPATAVGIVQMPENLIWIVVIIYGVSFLQSQIVAPLLANESMNLPPVFVLVGQIIFGVFFGFLGVMFAVPLTALLLLIVDEIYIKDVLGDKTKTEEEIRRERRQREDDALLPDGV
jgi:predicted PurR-regulated permease PerM